MDWQSILFEYVCPVGGCFLASSVFAAPINDLKQAMSIGDLGYLNTTPYAIMFGNCLGWCAYSYYTSDPFVLASNLPGLILSLWLNIGACKLQYLAQIRAINPNGDLFMEVHDDELDMGDGKPKFAKQQGVPLSIGLTSSPQDRVLFTIISLWAIILVCVRWLSGLLHQMGVPVWEPQTVVGILVNINLVFFYGAPLQTMKTVLETKSSDSIHTPTVTMNVINAVFWMSYGLTREDIIIYGPNGVGLFLGIGQVALCCIYPKRFGVAMPGTVTGEESAELRSLPSTGPIS